MASIRRRGSLVAGLVVLAVVVAVTTPLGACAPAKKVLVIGDSLTVGSVAAGMGSGDDADWTVSAEIGRNTSEAIAIAIEYDIEAYDLVIVALGTNDYLDSKASYRAKVDDVLEALGPEAEVIWVNVDPGTDHLAPAADGVNPAISEAASAHANLTVADWAAYVAASPDATTYRSADQIHYNAAGYEVRARWMESLVPGAK